MLKPTALLYPFVRANGKHDVPSDSWSCAVDYIYIYKLYIYIFFWWLNDSTVLRICRGPSSGLTSVCFIFIHSLCQLCHTSPCKIQSKYTLDSESSSPRVLPPLSPSLAVSVCRFFLRFFVCSMDFFVIAASHWLWFVKWVSCILLMFNLSHASSHSWGTYSSRSLHNACWILFLGFLGGKLVRLHQPKQVSECFRRFQGVSGFLRVRDNALICWHWIAGANVSEIPRLVSELQDLHGTIAKLSSRRDNERELGVPYQPSIAFLMEFENHGSRGQDLDRFHVYQWTLWTVMYSHSTI